MSHDPVGLALASIGAGAFTGAAAITAGLIVVRSAFTATGPTGPGGTVLSTALFLGIVAAAAIGWLLTRSIDDVFRRGVTAVIAAFGGLLLAGLAVPADLVGRVAGLVAYFGLLVAADLWAIRRARRAAAA